MKPPRKIFQKFKWLLMTEVAQHYVESLDRFEWFLECEQRFSEFANANMKGK